jgi:hypothetical protein
MNTIHQATQNVNDVITCDSPVRLGPVRGRFGLCRADLTCKAEWIVKGPLSEKHHGNPMDWRSRVEGYRSSSPSAVGLVDCSFLLLEKVVN